MLEALTTGVGSLPFVAPSEALDHVLKRYTVPFRPQLPKWGMSREDLSMPQMLRELLTEDMRVQMKKRDAHQVMQLLQEDASPSECLQNFPGWRELINSGAGYFAIKTQFAGPITLAKMIAEHVPEIPRSALLSATFAWIERLTRASAEEAVGKVKSLIIIWDDGYIASKSDAPMRQMIQELRSKLPKNVRLGFHSCSPEALSPWTRLEDAPTLCLDLSVIDVLGAGRVDALEHLRKKGDFIFGIVDTKLTKINPEQAMQLAGKSAQLLKEAGRTSPIILSGGCGTGMHQVVYETSLAQTLSAAAALIGVS